MPYYYGYGFGIDPLYLLVVLVCTVLGLAAQSYINSTYKTWSKVRSDGDTGATVARRMLDANGDAVKNTAYIKQAIDGGFQFYKVQTAA